ncbi:MAG: HD domain-containing protein [Gammaproteobacteria bacterium]|nr:HD domain-containing protein [Gammaproteobacteria bacterium]
MEVKINEKYDFYAKVLIINESTYDTCSVIVRLEDKSDLVVKVKKPVTLEIDSIYHFLGSGDIFKEKLYVRVSSFTKLEDEDIDRSIKNRLKDSFNGGVIIDKDLFIKDIEEAINDIDNKVLKDITSYIYNENKELFIEYPAAVRFHHAYKSGLLHHTHSLLELSKAFIKLYPHINKDLVYSGVILHDMMKIKEFNLNPTEFSLDGKLIGHVTLGVNEVVRVSTILGYEKEEETLLLEHILLSHHDQPEFGSPRRPQILEALIVHLCDTSDAKIEPVIEGLSKVKVGEFTEAIKTNDKEKYYKHKLYK